MQLPKSLKVGEHRYKVVSVDQAPRKGAMGEVDVKTKTITLGQRSWLSGKAFKTEQMDDTFWHELTHAILYEMNKHRLWRDEHFVSQFATLLTKAINSAKF